MPYFERDFLADYKPEYEPDYTLRPIIYVPF